MKGNNIFRWPTLIGPLIFLAVTVLLLKFGGSSALTNWVLAYSTIALVFVTWFYALQTKKLVEEEQNKREIGRAHV